MSEKKPETLNEAIDMIPTSYQNVFFVRNGGYRFNVTKSMGGGEFKIITNCYPTWQEAFEELWGKL